MKRIFGAAIVLLLSIVLAPVPNAVAQSTNNFSISEYDIQYELSRDSEGRSVLLTTETITAQFPDYDQNHGLERAIPTSYNGHPVALDIQEAKNLTDGSTQHSTSSGKGVTTLRIGDPDEYVQGEQQYRIIYKQRDVTRFYADTDRDEWYWDTNGVEWSVPISRLNVSVKINDELMSARVGEPACYRGLSGENGSCALTEDTTGGYTVAATNLRPGENVTVAFGFKPNTFSQYAQTWWEIALVIWVALQFITFILAFIIGIIAIVMYYRRNNRSSEAHTIVTEFIPPRDASVVVSSQVLGTIYGTVFTAQLIDLAVRRYISIVETKEKSMWKAAEYDILITADLEPLFAEEKEIISDMFGHLPKVGERLALKTLTSNMPYHARTMDNDKKIKELINTTYALRAKVPSASKPFFRWSIGLGVAAVLTLSLPLGFVAGIVALLGHALRPLTDKGLALKLYVLGLDKYIKAAETERIKFLQGPETAQKVGYAVDPSNPGQIVKLYERVLPYAILFGREKDWSARLGEFYQQSNTSPDWYTGNTAFNAIVFASAMSSFSQASSYSGGSSSSSGGSSGGGSSGGGGGGGGGGGW